MVDKRGSFFDTHTLFERNVMMEGTRQIGMLHLGHGLDGRSGNKAANPHELNGHTYACFMLSAVTLLVYHSRNQCIALLRRCFPEEVVARMVNERIIGTMDSMRLQHGKIRLGITKYPADKGSTKTSFVISRTFGTKLSNQESLSITFDDDGDFTFEHNPSPR